MALKLMYITNQENVAKIAEKSGVDWIFIDLEINGKDLRQGHLNTVISRHRIEDVKKIKRVLTNSELLVRVNPIFEGSKDEIDQVINDGADIVMLPFFKTKNEVELFVSYVDGRSKVCLLCETSEAVENIDSILNVEGIDYIHIGLNDLHLSYNMHFMFELLANGTVEKLCRKFDAAGILYGFGGIAQLGQGILQAENIMAEHFRLGSSMAILSRSFCNIKKSTEIELVEDIFKFGVNEIREFESHLMMKNESFFINNQKFVKDKVMDIVYTITR
ncbi:aldolase [Jeotgalibacillus sp. S-D1]|uniref:aldolase/citrate lyase family protein n=1 Tax=Jeotgalibacillus sp. S-D1 TaxID=2552189 RepID=UPI00105A94F9|nr:aldolase/citrate lyase family protein [Jeotgalibacillus sp. S-D1]TDL32843.1 aldolase [Jeotgalibacillus sp. S-D1]